jgi:hypothetical protein
MLLSQFECDVIVRVASEYFPIFYSNNNKIISNKISQLISNLIVGIILRLNILNEVQMKKDKRGANKKRDLNSKLTTLKLGEPIKREI